MQILPLFSTFCAAFTVKVVFRLLIVESTLITVPAGMLAAVNVPPES